MDFKVPVSIAQDLLLIQNLVGTNETPPQTKRQNSLLDDDIHSSGESEDEIEAELVVKPESYKPTSQSSDETSSSDSSDSDISDDERDKNTSQDVTKVNDEVSMMDEEDAGPSTATSSYFTTKNEIVDTSISVPDIEQVDPSEHLELVGEVLNIVDNAVIIKGLQTELARGGSDRTLDVDTLLVFEDGKVLGYVFETFGPTTQPMYQVKFDPKVYPLNPDKVRISCKVYHIPRRSNFVFIRQIQAFKGSDASNMNDEEPAEHELEFSDDEAEAEHKRNLKKKRSSSRASSAVPSRQSTPAPSQMRDADMANEDYFMNNNAYDEIGPYDLSYDAPISRPAPVPYEDPYADEFERPSSHASSIHPYSSASSTAIDASSLRPPRRSANREAGRRDDGYRGRGRGRGNNNRRNYSGNQQVRPHSSSSSEAQSQFYQQSPLSPAGQWPFPTQNQGMPDYGGNPYSSPQQFITPHINPLFANQFRMGIGGVPFTSGLPLQSQIYHAPTDASLNWSEQWVVETHGNGEEVTRNRNSDS